MKALAEFLSYAAGPIIFLVVVAGFLLSIYNMSKPDIEYKDFYRFCLEKNIKLDDCKVPSLRNCPYPLNNSKCEP